jgi:tetratricopeptide (TPR) repeat protein
MKKFWLLIVCLIFLTGCVANKNEVDYYLTGQDYLNSLEYTKALSEFTNGKNQNKEDFKYYLAIADIYTKKNRLADAIEILKEGNSAVDSVEIKNALGDLYRLNGDFEESLKYFEEVLATEGQDNNLMARKGRVKTMIMLQRYEELETESEYLEKVIPESEYHIMISVLSINEPEKAVNLLLKSSSIDNSNLELVKELRMAYAGFEKSQNVHNLSQIAYVLLNYNWYEIAQFPVDKLIRENEFFETGYLYRGLIQIHVNKLAEAQTSLVKALEINPENNDTKIFLAQTYFLQDADDKALELINTLLSNPELQLNLQQYMALQEILYKQDQPDLIMALHDRFSEAVLVPDSKNLIYPEVLLETEKYNQAESFLTTLSDDESGFSKSESAKYKALLATAYYNNNKKQDALKLIDESLKTDNKIAVVHYYYGLIQKSEGKSEEASASFSRARELDLSGRITWLLEKNEN